MRKGNIYLPTQINFSTDDRTLYLLSKFEHNGHYYLLCKNDILHKVNIYELGYYSWYPYIRILTDNQVQKRLTPFREWLKRVNFNERRYCVKYVSRDTGKIDMRSTIPHLL